MILLKVDMNELRVLHPIIEAKANALIDEYYAIHTAITKWECIEYDSKKGKYITPFEHGVRYQYTDGTDLYYTLFHRNSYGRVDDYYVHTIPFEWLFDDSWKEAVTLTAESYKALRTHREAEYAERKAQEDIKKLLELLDKYPEEGYKWYEGE